MVLCFGFVLKRELIRGGYFVLGLSSAYRVKVFCASYTALLASGLG